MEIDIVIGNIESRIIGYLPDHVHQEIDDALAYKIEGIEHSPKVKDGIWDGYTRLYKKNRGQSFYTGLLSIVIEVLQKNNIRFRKVDRREIPEKNLLHLTFTPPPNYEERDYQQFSINRAINKTRGIFKIATGGGKCLGKGTPVMMFDGSIKPVEKIKNGDLLMGPDSTPRKVLSITSGYGQLYNVKQNNGDDFICNDAHILCLKNTSGKSIANGSKIQITAKEFHESSSLFKRIHKGYKVGVEFEEKESPIDPYSFGLWMAEKNTCPIQFPTDQQITSIIPCCYKYTSSKQRLKLLAGLLKIKNKPIKTRTIRFFSFQFRLIEEVCWLARSLGYVAVIKTKKQTVVNKESLYYVIIKGDISEIASCFDCNSKKRKNTSNCYGITVTPIGQGDYFGFEIDGDREFLLGDFTVTHNTMIASELIARIKTGPFMFYVLTKDLMNQTYDVLSATLNEPIGKIGGGICDIKMINVCTIQTAIRAINMENKRFNLSDYTFDEEDADLWKESETFSIEKQQMIRKVIQSAKGIFVDEMHHSSAQTVKDIITASPYAYWKFGGSATPYREDGADMMLQSMFGKKIVDINASYLIEKGFLCTPYIIFDPIEHNTPLHSYKSIYKACVSENISFNSHVADLAKFLMEKELITLILVQQIKQGKLLQTYLPDIPFIHGKTKSNIREQAIEDLRNKKIKCLIATTLADEGLDIPSLDVALLAGGGASATRVNQRIGRTLRIDRKAKNPRKKSIVIYFAHKVKYLEKHTRKTKRIIKEEPKFKIINSQGALYIKREIEEIMGLDITQKTLFD